MLSQQQDQEFKRFYRAAQEESALDERSQALVGLATSLALGCSP